MDQRVVLEVPHVFLFVPDTPGQAHAGGQQEKRTQMLDDQSHGGSDAEQRGVNQVEQPRRYLGRCRSKKAQITAGPFGSLGAGPNNRG